MLTFRKIFFPLGMSVMIFFFPHLFIFGCTGSLLLPESFLQLLQAEAALQLRSTGFSHHHRLQLTQAGQLWYMGLVVLPPPPQVESSQTKDQTHVPCTGRWILNHWETRDVDNFNFFFFIMKSRLVNFKMTQRWGGP